MGAVPMHGSPDELGGRCIFFPVIHRDRWLFRDIVEGGQGYQLREAAADYKRLFEGENGDIGLEKAYFWKPNVQ